MREELVFRPRIRPLDGQPNGICGARAKGCVGQFTEQVWLIGKCWGGEGEGQVRSAGELRQYFGIGGERGEREIDKKV